jgi:hypothetical protein
MIYTIRVSFPRQKNNTIDHWQTTRYFYNEPQLYNIPTWYLSMRSNDTRTYLEQFWKWPEIWEIKKQILVEWFDQNIPDLAIEAQVDSIILMSSLMAWSIIREKKDLDEKIQSDLQEVSALISLEKIKKENWHYIADSDHPNITKVMLELAQGNKQEYHRLYREAILCLQYLNTWDKGYFDPKIEEWKQEAYHQKYSNYIELLREMCELKIINQMIEEKWRNAPDLE